ncbi:MAG: hypothetical protein A3J74_04770 [Elusimicrobia bacterium RIFCSPHIGHO2_02_FULL_57_9]|nr:MAG: hypothetical protein A3J74_04770 [Elusimicrobia bacterium RIFCSPHIGHO2_02_FULL_57_9]
MGIFLAVAGLLTAIVAPSFAVSSSWLPAAQPTRLTFLALGSYEYDSNVLQLPQTGGDSPTDKEDLSYFAFLFANYRGVPSSRTQWRAFAFWKDYEKLNDLDMSGLSLGIQQGIPVSIGETYWRYETQYFQLDRRNYLLLHSAGVDYDILRKRPEKIVIGYRAGYRDFIPASFEGLEGFQQRASLALSRSFHSWLKALKLKGDAYREDPHDSKFKHKGAEGLLEAALGLPDEWELKLSPSARWRRCDLPDASNFRREEFLVQYAAALSRSMNKWLGIEFSYAYGQNRANRPSLEYKKSVAAISLTLAI